MKTNYLKKTVKYLLVFAGMFPSSCLWAQNEEFTPLSEPFDFLAVKDIKLETSHVYDKGKIQHWTGEGLHAGIQSFHLTVFNCSEIQKDVTTPDNPSFIFEIKDMEGNIVASQEESLTSMFNMLKFVKSFSKTFGAGETVLRGGKYKLAARIFPDLYSYEREFVLVDEPCMQIFDNTTMADSLLSPKVILTSGYPYDSADFSGEKYLQWQIASANSPTTVIAEKRETFELKSETPTLAADATLNLTVEDIEPGEYLYTLTSDFAPANYSFKAYVYDVLMPEISIDKSVYTVGESREAIVKVEMDYGYPYVGAATSSDKPTVTVNAELLNEATSVSYSDEAWADSDMHCIAEIKIPLEKVNEEVVEEYKGEIPLNISIEFNGVTRFETTLILPFENKTTGIDYMKAEKTDGHEIKYYNIFGVEVDESYRGLVISSDGRKIIR